MNWDSLMIGFCSFLLIGLFHPIVIKVEYHFGKRAWPMFLLCGLGLLGTALIIEHKSLSAVTSIAGFSCFWSIHELYKQEERVRKGWFPANPGKNQHLKNDQARRNAPPKQYIGRK